MLVKAVVISPWEGDNVSFIPSVNEPSKNEHNCNVAESVPMKQPQGLSLSTWEQLEISTSRLKANWCQS